MRLRYANVTSTVAVVIALTGGTAYAASAIVDRAKLANNALALGSFNAARYRQDVSSATSTAQVAVSPGNWVTVLAWKFTTHRPGYMWCSTSSPPTTPARRPAARTSAWYSTASLKAAWPPTRLARTADHPRIHQPR